MPAESNDQSPPLYRIVDWDSKHENNRSRELKVLSWTYIPNRFDGDRIGELIGQCKAAGYGAWCAMLAISGRCEPRGILIRSTGKPHDARSMSKLTGLETRAFTRTIEVAISIGLIDTCTISQEGAISSAPSRTLPPLKEGKKEGKERKNAVVFFDQFWELVPNKVARDYCEKIWKSKNLDSLGPQIVEAMENQNRHRRASKSSGAFTPNPPNPSTWLNRRRWKDAVGSEAGDEHERTVEAARAATADREREQAEHDAKVERELHDAKQIVCALTQDQRHQYADGIRYDYGHLADVSDDAEMMVIAIAERVRKGGAA